MVDMNFHVKSTFSNCITQLCHGTGLSLKNRPEMALHGRLGVKQQIIIIRKITPVNAIKILYKLVPFGMLFQLNVSFC